LYEYIVLMALCVTMIKQQSKFKEESWLMLKHIVQEEQALKKQ